MKTRKTLMALAILVALAGCSSAPVTPIAGTAPMTVAPSSVIPTIPSWYVNPPASTPTEVFVSGTATSRDLGMSYSKARMDAETHLATVIAGEINTMMKDYKRDVGDESVQTTELIANKVAIDVRLIGGIEANRMVYPEGGGFRTYVLFKFPLGNSNYMLQNYLNKKTFKGSKEQAERELEKKTQEQRGRDAGEISPLGLRDPKEEN